MKFYQANSIGDLLSHKLLLRPCRLKGLVHSLFSAVINIECDGELITVGKKRIKNGPYNILLPASTGKLNCYGIKQGDQVYISRHELVLPGLLKIDLNNAKIWSSDWRSFQPNLKRSFQQLPGVKKIVLETGNLQGLGLLLKMDFLELSKSKEVIRKILKEVLSKVILDLNQENLLNLAIPKIVKIREDLLQGSENFWDRIKQLIGLGPGLTPAGDDFIAGFLLACRYLEFINFLKLPKLDLESFKTEVKSRTNLISTMSIILAIGGRPSEIIGDLIYNFFSCKNDEIIRNILQLIELGCTSGTDILTGILLALDFSKNLLRENSKI